MGFYCQKICGGNFSIEEWNKLFKLHYEAGTDMPKEEPCKEQCFDCLAIVGERRIKTKKIIKQKSL